MRGERVSVCMFFQVCVKRHGVVLSVNAVLLDQFVDIVLLLSHVFIRIAELDPTSSHVHYSSVGVFVCTWGICILYSSHFLEFINEKNACIRRSDSMYTVAAQSVLWACRKWG